MVAGFLTAAPPRMPGRRAMGGGPAAVAALLHVGAAMLLMLVVRPPDPAPATAQVDRRDVMRVVMPRLVFEPAEIPGGGGGGGGNRQDGPIRRAEARGRDTATLRTGPRPIAAADDVIRDDPGVPAIVIEARSLASGMVSLLGLPSEGVDSGTSTGPGTGGGVGTGSGTGIGAGRGAGIGPGSGGGFGGGAYRPGGGVTPPRLLLQVKPRYTADALGARIQGSVWLEVVVTQEGRAGQVRVTRPLDPGLDVAAMEAIRQWRFAPGSVAGLPVDVLVSVVMDFSIQ